MNLNRAVANDVPRLPIPRGLGIQGLRRAATIGLGLAALLLVLVVLTGHLRYVTVSGVSMEPALHDGQYLVVEGWSYRLGEPERGDVVMVRLRNEDWFFAEMSGGQFVKRIVGLPGETVEIRAGQVYVDGTAMEEPYLAALTNENIGPVTIDPNAYYILGDNRAASDDSRVWGPLAKDRIKGRVWHSW